MDPPQDAAPPLPSVLRDHDGRLYTVRAHAPEDRPRLEAFYDAFEPKRSAQGLPPEGPARVRRWLDGVLAGGAHLIVEAEGALVGHAMLMPTQREGEREYAIFLDDAVRGRGVGTEVNRLAARVARGLGIQRLWLSVEPHNRPAVRSYQKAGFRCRAATIYSSELEMEMVLEEGGV